MRVQRVASLEDIVWRRDGNQILDNVSFALHEGERWALLGPNGAGKTTLLSMLSATEFPTSGTVEVLGKRLGRYPIQQLWPHIGTVSSRFAPSFRMTVRDVVLSGCHGAAATPYLWEPDAAVVARSDELLAELGITALQEHWWDTLSSGEQRRTLLARALMNEPSYLVLDEAASGLDFPAREHLLEVLDDLASRRPHLAMVMVTHHLEELPESTTHVALMRNGSLLATGTADSVLTDARLSDCFGFPIVVRRDGERWSAIASRG